MTIPLERFQPGPTDRAIFIGQTGSGKTTLAQYLCELRKYVVVLDPKGLIRWPGYTRVTSLNGIKQIHATRNPRVIYAPIYGELRNAETIDAFLQWVYERGNCTLYIDEVAAISSASEYPFHLGACYMRGRERRLETWAATQRPARIPLICISAAENTYCFYLKMRVDLQRAENDTGIPQEMIHALPKRQFIYTGNGPDMLRMQLNPETVTAMNRKAFPQPQPA